VPPAAHLKWKHRGYWLGEDHLLTRNGFWSRTVTVVPYYRIQNVIDARTIFQRRWDVATIIADTAGSSSIAGNDAAAVDFATDEAVDLRETLRERLRVAVAKHRDRRDRFEWFDGDAEGSGEIDDSTPGVDEPTADDETTSDEDDESRSDVPDDGVIRPNFSGSDRDYSEPAERIDTGEYAVDRSPSDMDGESGSGTEEAGSGNDERDEKDDIDDAEDGADSADNDANDAEK